MKIYTMVWTNEDGATLFKINESQAKLINFLYDDFGLDEILGNINASIDIIEEENGIIDLT